MKVGLFSHFLLLFFCYFLVLCHVIVTILTHKSKHKHKHKHNQTNISFQFYRKISAGCFSNDFTFLRLFVFFFHSFPSVWHSLCIFYHCHSMVLIFYVMNWEAGTQKNIVSGLWHPFSTLISLPLWAVESKSINRGSFMSQWKKWICRTLYGLLSRNNPNVLSFANGSQWLSFVRSCAGPSGICQCGL